ncbi:hypothetical protein ACU4GD_31855 [Cupriavidus basilensis]
MTIITVPSPLICPWIRDGRALGSLTRLSTAQFFLLLEVHRRIAPDVEGFPIQDRPVRGLPDRDAGTAIDLGLHRRVGVLPTGGQRIGVDLQPAFDHPLPDSPNHPQGCLARGSLCRPLRGHAASSAGSGCRWNAATGH